jgi:hypothetical protein
MNAQKAPRIVKTKITNGSPKRITRIFIFQWKLFYNLLVSCCVTGTGFVIVVVFVLFRLNVPVIPGSSSKFCSNGL